MTTRPDGESPLSETPGTQTEHPDGPRAEGNSVHPLDVRYRRFFDTAGEMRFVTSRCGKLLEINRAGVELFRFENKEEMLRIPSVAILFRNPEDGKSFQLLLEAAGFVKDYEVQMVRRDGSAFMASVTASLWFEEDGTISCEGALRDITEVRQLQEAFLEAEKHNRELTESERSIRELNQHILSMLMIMSHDIRGPLVSMAATLKLLLRGSFGRMDESVWNTVQDLLVRVRNQISIAEDCLGRAYLLDGKLRADRDVIDLRQDIIDPVLDELSNEMQHERILIDNRLGAIPAGCIPLGTEMMWLKAVFRNLFKNAIKYGGAGSRIAFGFEDHGTFYRLNVYNSGHPIPEEFRGRLFTKLTRAVGGGEQQEGFGMGLYLIREIIRKHGGDIWYEPQTNGSDFILIVPKDKK